MRVEPATREDVRWLTDRIGVEGTPRLRAIKAVDGRGIRGMVAFDEWTKGSCQAHMAVDAPIVWRSLLRPAFVYPFEQVGLRVILAVVRATNRPSLAMVTHLGFTPKHVIEDGYDEGESLVLFEMRRENCTWLRKANA